jgi:hypothetical protein
VCKMLFFGTHANFIHMVKLILVALKKFDGKCSYMGNVWFIMKTLEKHVQLLGDPPFSLSPKFTSSVKC